MGGSVLILMNKNNKFRAVICAVVFNIALLPLNVSAAVTVDHSFSVEAGTRYHSNLNFLEDNRESVFLYTANPQYQILAEDGINEWTGVLGFILQRSSNVDVIDHRRDPNLNVGWKRQLERGLFSIGASYSKFSSRDTQFTETGRVTNDSTSIDKNLNAVWEHNLTNRLLFRLNGEYNKVKFEDETTLTDFNTRLASVGLEYKINEKITPFVLAVDNRFAATAQPTIKFREYQAGAIYTISPRFTITAGAGVTTVANTGEREGTGAIAVVYERPRSQTTVGFNRTVFPTGVGVVQTGNTFTASHMYDLSQKSRLGLSLGADNNDDGFNSQSISGSYGYDINPTWVLGMDVTHLNLKIDGTPSVTDSSVGFTITYIPLQR